MTLRELQLEELEILVEFQQFCDRFQLQYYLTAGTLLGAIRHRGFIPWDDDIDIAMPRKDYDKLQKLAGEIPFGYFLQSFRTEPNFPYYFSKIRKNGTTVQEPILGKIEIHQGIYIDIFPLDRCPDNDKIALLFFKAMELFSAAILSRVTNGFVCGYQKKYMRIFWQILRRFPNRFLFLFREWIRRFFLCFSSGQKLCTVGGHHGFPRETYDTKWLKTTVSVQFESRQFSAPIGWDDILKNMYGDYMTPLEEEQRNGHFEA